MRCGEHERMIEGNDTRHDAIRLMHRVMQPARSRGNGLTLQFATEASEVFEITGGNLDVGTKLADGVAGITRLKREDLRTSTANGLR